MTTRLAILALALIAVGPQAPAETVNTLYVAYTDSDPFLFWERTRAQHRSYRYWRADDGGVRLEYPLIAMSIRELISNAIYKEPRKPRQTTEGYFCVRLLVFATDSELYVINQLNNKGVRLPRQIEPGAFVESFEASASCFELCPFGKEVDWFEANHKSQLNGNWAPYVYERDDERWVLTYRGRPGTFEPVSVEYKKGPGEIAYEQFQRNYNVYASQVAIDDQFFLVPQNIQWLSAPTSPDLADILMVLGSPPRPEHFLLDDREIETGDYNFDGHRDFSIGRGVNGKCGVYDYFTYSAVDDTFIHQPRMTGICFPIFDQERKAIYTFSPGGWSSTLFHSDKYIWLDGELTLVSVVKQVNAGNFTAIRQYFINIDGELELIKEQPVQNHEESGNFIQYHEELNR